MSTLEVSPAEPLPGQSSRPVVNDFSLQVATVNGSGSQTANSVLMRAIFQMGIPVSGKNMFPSNIAGLPTWFTIRASKHGYIGRKKEVDFLVAMNPETAREDVLSLEAGAAVVYDEPLKLNALRTDLHFYPVPFDKLVAPVCPDAKLRKLVRNMIYTGIVAQILLIDMEEIRKALVKQFGKRKAKAAELNWGAAKAGFDYAVASLPKADPFRVERMDGTAGKIIIDGNSACALGAMFAGVTVVTWYPITPSSSLVESLIGYVRRYRHDPATGKATYAIVQAEDELASIGMALGAGWAGARSMTATAGPGISLMSEFIGLGYYAECPAVIYNVERVGPSTGLPTRTAQGDILTTALLSHGDTRHPMYFPSSPEECFSMSQEAFNLAEYFQTPVFIMTDLDLGMNNWMADAFAYPEVPVNRGKVLTAEDLNRLGGFARYKDVDGDGVGYRTLPGTNHPNAAYFTRGSGHNDKAQYTEREDDYINNMDRLSHKFEHIGKNVPVPVVHTREGASIGFIAVGTSDYAVRESQDQLQNEHGVKADYLRVRAYPFNDDVVDFIRAHERVYVVDQNRDGQLHGLMKLDLEAPEIGRLRSLRYYGGLPLDARTVTDEVIRMEGKCFTVTPPPKKVNHIGLEVLPYKGGKTTLCAGCGHNAISERIIECFYDLGVEPWRVAKFSGIGCSSKSPAYFLGMSHGFNSVHGRMPAIASGALLANHSLLGLGVTGDGDTASIGLGQFMHLVRRNIPMIYIIEDNGVYGLTKGQFSATADVGSKLKTGTSNDLPPFDCCALALRWGATFVARSFSGDKKQLQAIIKSAIAHRGLSVIDVVSPCVTFNDHEGSTKSYSYMKEHEEALHELDFVPSFEDISVEIPEGAVQDVTLHDGSHLRIRKLGRDYDPTNRTAAAVMLEDSHRTGEVLTGVLYVNTEKPTFLDVLGMVEEPLALLPESRVRPPRAVLDEVMEELR